MMRVQKATLTFVNSARARIFLRRSSRWASSESGTSVSVELDTDGMVNEREGLGDVADEAGVAILWSTKIRWDEGASRMRETTSAGVHGRRWTKELRN